MLSSNQAGRIIQLLAISEVTGKESVRNEEGHVTVDSTAPRASENAAACSNGQQDCQLANLKLQHTFVAMLFALAAGSAAASAADILSLLRSGHDFVNAMPALSHALLALLVIAMSWIEWSRATESMAANDPLHSIIKWRFLMLLLDVTLVVLYFLLAHEIEITTRFAITSNGYRALPALLPPEVRPELYWSVAILAGYLVYDLAVDVVMARGGQLLRRIIVGCGASLIALFATIIIWWLVNPTPSVKVAVATDIALIAVFIMFRLLKCFETCAAKILKVNDMSRFGPREFDVSAAYTLWVFTFLAFVAFAIYGR